MPTLIINKPSRVTLSDTTVNDEKQSSRYRTVKTSISNNSIDQTATKTADNIDFKENKKSTKNIQQDKFPTKEEDPAQDGTANISSSNLQQSSQRDLIYLRTMSYSKAQEQSQLDTSQRSNNLFSSYYQTDTNNNGDDDFNMTHSRFQSVIANKLHFTIKSVKPVFTHSISRQLEESSSKELQNTKIFTFSTVCRIDLADRICGSAGIDCSRFI